MEQSPSRTVEQNNHKGEIESFIEKLDFNSLRDVLSGILKKTGVNLERLEKIKPDLFEIVKKPYFIEKVLHSLEKITGSASLGGYDATRDKILLREHFLHLKEDEIFLTIVHELVHSISDIEINESRFLLSGENINVGLSEGRYSKIPGMSSFETNNLLNEGLTELIAEAVTVEFFRRKGQPHKLEDTFSSIYHVGKDLVRILVLAISEKSGQPEDVVFFALVKAVFDNDFNEFKLLLADEKQLDELLEKIAVINEEEDLLKRNLFSSTAKYQAYKLHVDGLDSVLRRVLENRDTYYNPLMNTLKET